MQLLLSVQGTCMIKQKHIKLEFSRTTPPLILNVLLYPKKFPKWCNPGGDYSDLVVVQGVDEADKSSLKNHH